MFWKKVNRGLLLGAALLLFLVGFIVVKEVQFKKETPLIVERAESYLSGLCELQCGVDGTLGEKLSPQAQSAQKEKFNRLLKENWYGELSGDEYNGIGLSELYSDYESYLSDKVQVLFSKAELHLQEDHISVYKDGPDRAKVSFSAEIKTEYMGDGESFFYGSSYYIGYEDGIAVPETSATVYSGVYLLNMTFEMQRVGREWKIVAYNGYGYESMSAEKGE